MTSARQSKLFDVARVVQSEDQIVDFISGELIKTGPEEVEAVQVFARRLVEEYGYSREQIQTRPQLRIKSSPSAEEKYPVDIAIFNDERKTHDNLFMIVECKRRNRLDGLHQLQIYLGLSSAQIGVWFNGIEHAYIQKVLDDRGTVTYREIPNIPKKGQRIEDIGKFKRRDLKPPSDLKVAFRDIRNHLAGMTTGITRDESLAQEIINLLFCKIYDEVNTEPEESVTFRAGIGETSADIKERMSKLFEEVKRDYSDVFDVADRVNLDPDSLTYVVGELQNYCIRDADRDAIGDAFEIFIGPALRGGEGQFFTPRNVVKMMIEILDPSPGEYIIDPACGSGGFLIAALEHVWRKLDKEGARKKWSTDIVAVKRREIASRFFRGIDKDTFLAKVTKAYMAIVGDGRGGVFCENSLKNPSEWHHSVREKIGLAMFDVVVTNPPHGSRITVRGEQTLSQYDLARKWRRDRTSSEWNLGSELKDKEAPQIIFIERCLQLLKPGGRMGIILPESLFGNPSHGYIVSFLRRRVKIIGLVSMPEELFQPHTHNKTCTVLVENTPPPEDYSVFMSIAKWCGHDSRGNKIPFDDIPLIASEFKAVVSGEKKKYTRLGFTQRFGDIRSNVLIPKYYDPEIAAELQQLKSTHELVAIGELIKQKTISLDTGVEIGRLSYGTGSIPFVRTSDIANWELKIDPKHGVSERIYLEFSKRKAVRENDILLVRDGTYLVGTPAIVTKYDTRILFQSHMYRIRVLKPSIISPYLLLALLSTPIVRRQIRAKQFTQDIIDTLGRRILEVVLPVPKNRKLRDRIANETKTIVEQRTELRERAKKVTTLVTGRPERLEESGL